MPDRIEPQDQAVVPIDSDELTPEQLETIRRFGEASRTRIIAILSMPDEWSQRKSIHLYTSHGKENLK